MRETHQKIGVLIMEKSLIQGDNPQVTNAKLGWLAGIIEGEGTLTLAIDRRKNYLRYQAMLQICNTDSGIILESINIIKSLGVKYYFYCREKGFNGHLGKKTLYNLQINRMESLKLILEKIIPFMFSLKKSKAILIEQWLNLRIPKKNQKSNMDRQYTSEELSLIEKIRNLNDFTRDSETEKIKSELEGKLSEAAEMTARLNSLQLGRELSQ
jgi:hypothetical protein